MSAPAQARRRVTKFVVGLVTESDNFNRADSTGLGANWTALTGIASLDVVSNVAQQHAAGATNGDRWTANANTANQFSQSTFPAAPANYNLGYVLCRCASGAFSAYAGGFSSFAFGNRRARIVKIVAGVETNLQAHASQDIAAGDIVKLKVVTNGGNDDLTLTVNGTDIVTTSVASVFASGQPGIVCRSPGTQGQFNDWSGGDV